MSDTKNQVAKQSSLRRDSFASSMTYMIGSSGDSSNWPTSPLVNASVGNNQLVPQDTKPFKNFLSKAKFFI